jgi:hypothetical protein
MRKAGGMRMVTLSSIFGFDFIDIKRIDRNRRMLGNEIEVQDGCII